MPNRLFFLWILFAALMGFALGGSVVSAWLTPASVHARCSGTEHSNPDCKTPQEIKESTDAALAYYTKWLMIGTGALAAATIALFIATYGLSISSEKQIEISKSALTDLEAPFLVLIINTPGLDVKGPTISFGVLEYCVANYGRTPATILEYFDKIDTVDFGKDPSPIDPTKERGQAVPYGIIAPPGGNSDQFSTIPFGQFVTENPRSPRTSPFFIGFVRYQDIFKTRFVLGFCFIFDRKSNAWIRIGGDEYNYCQKDSERPPTPTPPKTPSQGALDAQEPATTNNSQAPVK